MRSLCVHVSYATLFLPAEEKVTGTILMCDDEGLTGVLLSGERRGEEEEEVPEPSRTFRATATASRHDTHHPRCPSSSSSSSTHNVSSSPLMCQPGDRPSASPSSPPRHPRHPLTPASPPRSL